MRKTFFILLVLLTFGSYAQNKQLLYNFDAIPQSAMINPGIDQQYQFYVGVPLLSGVSFNFGSTGFSAHDLFADNGVDFNDKVRAVLSRVSRKDHITINEQVEILSGGFAIGHGRKKGYLSFGLYQEFDLAGYVPKDLATLALEGNRDYLGKQFNLGDLEGEAEYLSVLHLGYHKYVTDNLVLGARAKIYSSAFNVSSTNNSGYIVTDSGTETVYDQTIYSDVTINTSGASEFVKDNYNGNVVEDVLKKTFSGGNLGLGFDLGFTYYPKNNIQITGSMLDIGFVTHTKEVKNYIYKGYYEYEGVNPNFEDASSSGNAYEEFRAAVPQDSSFSSYTTWRPIKFNASYQYSFDGNRRGADCDCSGQKDGYKNAVGAQLYVRTMPRTPIAALTGFYRREMNKNLQLKATYTIDSYSYTNLGLGLSGQLGKVNLYFLADNLLEYGDLSKANSLSMQFGINLLFPEK